MIEAEARRRSLRTLDDPAPHKQAADKSVFDDLPAFEQPRADDGLEVAEAVVADADKIFDSSAFRFTMTAADFQEEVLKIQTITKKSFDELFLEYCRRKPVVIAPWGKQPRKAPVFQAPPAPALPSPEAMRLPGQVGTDQEEVAISAIKRLHNQAVRRLSKELPAPRGGPTMLQERQSTIAMVEHETRKQKAEEVVDELALV
mmetsp:Transcript_9502/g.22717  ORF Transcript_9502/g.22717 Transcript_9502/m.22717 type:complete len:202 (+) Transcript_9502:3-608(+)